MLLGCEVCWRPGFAGGGEAGRFHVWRCFGGLASFQAFAYASFDCYSSGNIFSARHLPSCIKYSSRSRATKAVPSPRFAKP